MIKNPQVNCEDIECYYNIDKKCRRAGIHASKKSCCCFVKINGKIKINKEVD